MSMGSLVRAGAGKYTTIRILFGLLRPNAGETELLGGDPCRDVVELHRRLAYVLIHHLVDEELDLVSDLITSCFELAPPRRAAAFYAASAFRAVEIFMYNARSPSMPLFLNPLRE